MYLYIFNHEEEDMSNFNFLIENKKFVEQFPWLFILYKDTVNVEKDFCEGDLNRFFRDSRCAMEFAINKYIQEMNITVKSKKNRKYKKGEVENKKKTGFDSLQEKIDTIQPKGELLIEAHFIRKYGNIAIHEGDLVRDDQALFCLKNLYDVLVWMYCDLTNDIVTNEFLISHIDKTINDNDCERIEKAYQIQKSSKTKEKIKESKKRKKWKTNLSIVRQDGQIVVSDKEKNEVFSYTEQDTQNNNRYLPAVIEKMDESLSRTRINQKNVLEIVKHQISANQIALSEIQIYIKRFDLNHENEATLMEWFSRAQSEEQELLSNTIDKIESQIRDKEKSVEFLRCIMHEPNDYIRELYSRIENLEKDIESLRDSLKNVDLYVEHEWLSEWVKKVKTNFEDYQFNNKNDQIYSTEQGKKLINIFMNRYNKIYFLYESEKIIKENTKTELNKSKLRLSALHENNVQLENEKIKINETLKREIKRRKRWQNAFKYISMIFIILFAVMSVLVIWQKDKVEIYKNQYDGVMEKISLISAISDQNNSEDISSEHKEDTSPTDTEKDSEYGEIVNQVYTANDGSYQIQVPSGWNLYQMDNGTMYLGNNKVILESDIFYRNSEPLPSYDNATMNWLINFWEDEYVDFLDFEYTEYGGLPAVKNYSYVKFEINGTQGGNLLLTYTLKGKKEYEFNFVDRDSSGDLEDVADQMMQSIVFLNEERGMENTKSILEKLTSDMLEAFFVRRNVQDTLIHLTDEYADAEGKSILSYISDNPALQNFKYNIEIESVSENEAVGQVLLNSDGVESKMNTLNFKKENDAWKINYFGE